MVRRCWAAAVLTFLILASGCQPPTGTPSAAPSSSAAKSLTFVKPERRSLVRVIEQPGSIQAFEQTQLVARLPGYVRRVAADIGQRVAGPKYDAQGKQSEPGQLLAELEVPELIEESRQKDALKSLAEAESLLAQRSLLAAEAHIATAESAVNEARAGLARMQAQYERWESESRRLTELASRGVVDIQTRDETQKQFQAAAASRDEARSHLASSVAAVRKAQADRAKGEADIVVAQAKIAVAAAEAQRLKALLEFAMIRAPFDGVVTQRHVSPGDFLQPSVGKSGLFTITRLDPVRIVLHVPEMEASLIDGKTEAKLAIAAHGDSVVAARIARTSWALEAGARTLRAEIDLPNLDGRFRPGMYVFAKLEAKLPEAWTLPASALVKQDDQWTARMKIGEEVKRVLVRPGFNDGRLSELLGFRLDAASPWNAISGSEWFVAY